MNTLIVGDIGVGKTHLAEALKCGSKNISTVVIEAAALPTGEAESMIKKEKEGKICDVVVIGYPDQKFDMRMFDRVVTIRTYPIYVAAL